MITSASADDNWLLVRTKTNAKAFVPTLRRIVWSMDRDLPLENVQTMNELLGDSVADRRGDQLFVGPIDAAGDHQHGAVGADGAEDQ